MSTTPPHHVPGDPGGVVSAPGWTAHKAWAGAAAGALVAALGVLAGALDDGLQGNEVIDIILAALLGSGLTGGVVYRVPNQPRAPR